MSEGRGYVVCPHCGNHIGDLWEFEIHDEDVCETECGACEKPIEISVRVSWLYSIKPAPAPQRRNDDG